MKHMIASALMGIGLFAICFHGREATATESADGASTQSAPSTPARSSLAVAGPLLKSSAGASGPSTPTALPNYGGGAIVQPDIVPIYWGSFTQTQISTMQSYLQGLATYVSGSTSPQGQEPAVYQYGVRSARVESSYADTGHQPSNNGEPGHAVIADVQNEIATLQNQNNVPAYGPERFFMVFTTGITFDDDYCGNPGSDSNCFCAEHTNVNQNQWFSVDPVPSTTGCGSTGYGGFDATAIWQSQTSHELFEAATDPDVATGWRPEIGDQCNWGNAPENTVSLPFGAVQRVVDKLQNACSIWTTSQAPQVIEVSQPEGLLSEQDIFGWASDHSVVHLHGDSLNGWSTWQSLGGVFNSPPVAVAGARGTGTVDVFGQGTDNAFWVEGSSDSGQTWSGWTSIGGVFNGPPAVVSPSSNVIDVFGLGTDGHYWTKEWTSDAGWLANWTQVGGANDLPLFNGPPAAIAVGSGKIALVGRSQSGNYFDQIGPPFSAIWTSFGFAKPFISEPSLAVEPGTGNFDVVGQENDGNYYHVRVVNGTPMGSLEHLAGQYMGPPSAAWESSTTFVVVGQGLDSQWYSQQEVSGTWQPLASTNGSGFGGASMVSPRQGLLHIVVEGTDNDTWFNEMQNNTLGNWGPLNSPSLH